MLCKNCGNVPSEHSRFCNTCGAAVGPETSSGIAVPPANTATPPKHRSGKATASLVTGIAGLFFIAPASVAAIILGHISRFEIRKSGGYLTGQGMALAGLILGYLGITVIPIMVIAAAVAVPNLLRARMAANEAAAVSAVATISKAEASYRLTFPASGYACSLSNLGGTEQFSISPAHAHLIGDTLSAGSQGGYRFAIQDCDFSGGLTVRYHVVAYPEKYMRTGIRAFCSDETGIVRFDPNGSPEACVGNGTVLP